MIKTWQIASLYSLFSLVPSRADDIRHVLEYSPAPVGNPLKGLVPYSDSANKQFPHSMEFGYLPLSSLVVGDGVYDWEPLNKLLNNIASRGHQAVFRIYLEIPGSKSGIPDSLVKDGFKIHRYRDSTATPPTDNITPDYSDPKLRKVLTRFISELGRKYDGDPRIGFITAGLLGYWGEWHTYPRVELAPKKDVQIEVMRAYQSAFQVTPILVRYPAGEGNANYAPNAKLNFGYHDDSFAWATLDTGNPKDSWFYMPALKSAGSEAMAKWKVQPIGGEIRPEAWGIVFDPMPGRPEVQNFRACVDATHVSWLLDTGMFRSPKNGDRQRRAETEVRHMGYEFYVKSITVGNVGDGRRRLRIEVENRGVAPFYYEWPAEIGIADVSGRIVRVSPIVGKLTGILPGSNAKIWDESLQVDRVAAGKYKLLLRVVNKLPNGPPVRFANRTQDAHIDGWLTLCEIVVK